MGGPELEVRGVVVVRRAEGSGEQRPRPGDLVRRGDLAPEADRGADLLGGGGRVALGEEDAGQGLVLAGLEGGRFVRVDDPAQFLRRRAGQRKLAPGDGDLDLGRQQPDLRPLVPRRFRQGRIRSRSRPP